MFPHLSGEDANMYLEELLVRQEKCVQTVLWNVWKILGAC